MTPEEVHERITRVPQDHRHYCGGGPCACIGCWGAYLYMQDVTEEEIAQWEEAHPDETGDDGYPTRKLRLAFRAWWDSLPEKVQDYYRQNPYMRDLAAKRVNWEFVGMQP